MTCRAFVFSNQFFVLTDLLYVNTRVSNGSITHYTFAAYFSDLEYIFNMNAARIFSVLY